MEYKIKKQQFNKQDLSFMQVFFDNGDYLPISKNEVIDFSLTFCDKLIVGEDYYHSFCQVIDSGFIKLKILKKCNGFYTDASLYNLSEYNRDRISYIKNRFCHENGMKFIRFFNENNRSLTYYANMSAHVDGDSLIVEFVSNAKFKSTAENCSILLPEINKSKINSIMIDFENCEGFEIFNDEILEMKLQCNSNLVWCENFNREIESGFIKIKFNKENNSIRKYDDFSNYLEGKNSIEKMSRRLCGKKGFDVHDICHLYIDYAGAGFGINRNEQIEIKDIRSEAELAEMNRLADEEGRDLPPYFIGGYCQKQDDGTILISFGKTAQKNEKCQKLLKKYSYLA